MAQTLYRLLNVAGIVMLVSVLFVDPDAILRLLAMAAALLLASVALRLICTWQGPEEQNRPHRPIS